jgi:hypothetical protein
MRTKRVSSHVVGAAPLHILPAFLHAMPSGSADPIPVSPDATPWALRNYMTRSIQSGAQIGPIHQWTACHALSSRPDFCVPSFAARHSDPTRKSVSTIPLPVTLPGQ